MEKSVSIIIRIKDAASGVLAGISGKFRGFTAGIGGMFKTLQSNWLAAVAAIYSIKKALDSTLSAYIAEEEQIRKLNAVLKGMGGNYEENRQAADRWITTMQAVTSYGDGETRQMLIDVGARVDDLTQAITISEAALGMEAKGLITAATAGEAFAIYLKTGQNRLQRYGITIGEAKTEGERWNNILKLHSQYQGELAGTLDSTAGKLKQLKNYIGDAGEELGKGFGAALNMVLMDLMGGQKVFDQAQKEFAEIGKISDETAKALDDLMTPFQRVARFIGTWIIPLFRQWFVGAKAILTPLRLLITILTMGISAAFEALHGNIKGAYAIIKDIPSAAIDELKESWEGVKDVFSLETLKAEHAEAGKFYDTMGALAGSVTKTKDTFKDGADAMRYHGKEAEKLNKTLLALEETERKLARATEDLANKHRIEAEMIGESATELDRHNLAIRQNADNMSLATIKMGEYEGGLVSLRNEFVTADKKIKSLRAELGKYKEGQIITKEEEEKIKGIKAELQKWEDHKRTLLEQSVKLHDQIEDTGNEYEYLVAHEKNLVSMTPDIEKRKFIAEAEKKEKEEITKQDLIGLDALKRQLQTQNEILAIYPEDIDALSRKNDLNRQITAEMERQPEAARRAAEEQIRSEGDLRDATVSLENERLEVQKTRIDEGMSLTQKLAAIEKNISLDLQKTENARADALQDNLDAVAAENRRYAEEEKTGIAEIDDANRVAHENRLAKLAKEQEAIGLKFDEEKKGITENTNEQKKGARESEKGRKFAEDSLKIAQLENQEKAGLIDNQDLLNAKLQIYMDQLARPGLKPEEITATQSQILDVMQEMAGKTYLSLEDAISGAVRAGFEGEDPIKNFADRVKSALMDAVVDALTASLMGKEFAGGILGMQFGGAPVAVGGAPVAVGGAPGAGVSAIAMAQQAAAAQGLPMPFGMLGPMAGGGVPFGLTQPGAAGAAGFYGKAGGGGWLGKLLKGGAGGGGALGILGLLGFGALLTGAGGLFGKKEKPAVAAAQPIFPTERVTTGAGLDVLRGSDIFQRAAFSARNVGGDVFRRFAEARLAPKEQIEIIVKPSAEFQTIVEDKRVASSRISEIRGIPSRTGFNHG